VFAKLPTRNGRQAEDSGREYSARFASGAPVSLSIYLVRKFANALRRCGDCFNAENAEVARRSQSIYLPRRHDGVFANLRTRRTRADQDLWRGPGLSCSQNCERARRDMQAMVLGKIVATSEFNSPQRRAD